MVSLLRPEAGDRSLYRLGTSTVNQSSRASLSTEVKYSEKTVEVTEWEDPEAKTVGHAKRPMILTYALMTGLTLIILLAIQGLILSKVSTE
jgi:hypothetical protein